MRPVEVPIIDMSGVLADAPGSKQKVAAEIRAACENLGLFIAVNHGVPEALLESTSDVAKEFFSLPPVDKEQVKYAGGSGPGYMPMLEENFEGNDCAPKECFNVMKAQQGLWPSRPAGFKPLVSEYFGAMDRLADTLMRLFALALDLPEDSYQDKFGRQLSFLRIVNYPDQESEPSTSHYRCEPHTDLGTLTILKSENRPGGLQVIGSGGEWADVLTPPGALVVNAADEMSRWTNGRWISPVHRVVNPPSEHRLRSHRLSLIFFHNPDSIQHTVESYLKGTLVAS